VHLTKRGGHAAAGGFSATPETWDAFVTAFAALPRPLPEDRAGALAQPNEVAIDLVLAGRHLEWRLLEEIEGLAPFGAAHGEPVLAVTGLVVGDARRVGADGGHLSMRMKKGHETLDAIAFGLDPERPTPEPGSAVDLVATLESRTFDGDPRLQLRIIDYASTDESPLRLRRRTTEIATSPEPQIDAIPVTS
jgi:single-stranded-DNA-specific exonuclease